SHIARSNLLGASHAFTLRNRACTAAHGTAVSCGEMGAGSTVTPDNVRKSEGSDHRPDRLTTTIRLPLTNNGRTASRSQRRVMATDDSRLISFLFSGSTLIFGLRYAQALTKTAWPLAISGP